MVDRSLQVVYEKLTRARHPEDIFSGLEAYDKAQQLVKAGGQFHYFAKLVHPDKYSNTEDNYVANEAMATLSQLYNDVREKINNGKYGDTTTMPSSSSLFTK